MGALLAGKVEPVQGGDVGGSRQPERPRYNREVVFFVGLGFFF